MRRAYSETIEAMEMIKIRRFFRIVPRVWGSLRWLVSPRLPWKYRLMVLAPIVLYVVLPDLIPFFPLDDMAVTLAFLAFIERWLARKVADDRVVIIPNDRS